MGYVGGKLAPMYGDGPLDRAVWRMADAGGDELHDLAVRNTPIDSGNLRSSWYREPTVMEGASRRSFRSRVKTDTEYAAFVEYGTGLYGPEHRKYLIEPKQPGGLLSWIGEGGERFYATRIWHPGSPGAHMMSSAAARLETTLGYALQHELDRWAHEQEALAAKANAA